MIAASISLRWVSALARLGAPLDGVRRWARGSPRRAGTVNAHHHQFIL